MPEYVNFMGVLVIAFISPIISAVIPVVRVPTIVIEFVLAVIVGPDVLGWIKVDNPLDVLSVLALAFLLFTAGTEVELSSLRGALLGRAAVGYVISFAIAGVVGVLLHEADIVMTPAFIAIVLSATGLGAVIPVVRGAGLTTTSIGQTILVVASVAEFSAVLLLSLLFGERDTTLLSQIAFMVVFAAGTAIVWFGLRWLFGHPRLTSRMDMLEGGTGQIGIRLAVLLLAVFLAMSSRFGLETILGAFVAGIILGDLRHHERGQEAGFWPKVDALGF